MKGFRDPYNLILDIFLKQKTHLKKMSQQTSIVCPKKDKSILVQTFVYVLLSNLSIFGQTIDVSLIKL